MNQWIWESWRQYSNSKDIISMRSTRISVFYFTHRTLHRSIHPWHPSFDFYSGAQCSWIFKCSIYQLTGTTGLFLWMRQSMLFLRGSNLKFSFQGDWNRTLFLIATWYLTVTIVHREFALSLTTRSPVYTSCITRKLLQRGNDNAIYANESLVRWIRW